MRRAFVTILAAGGLLALGAWTTPGQSADGGQARPAETAQAADQQAEDVCAPVQATGNAHRRRSHARDQVIGRSHTRPRASSLRPSDLTECPQSWTMVRRESHRAHRNAAIDRSLSQGH